MHSWLSSKHLPCVGEKEAFFICRTFQETCINTIIQALWRGTKAEDMEEGLSQEGTRVLLSYNYIFMTIVYCEIFQGIQ